MRVAGWSAWRARWRKASLNSLTRSSCASRPHSQPASTTLRWAQAILLGTPEKFGYMAGALKDFFDRTFYPTEGALAGVPYALFVSAGNDGTGAVASVDRIVAGYRWNRIADPVVVVGEPDEAAFTRCRELGQTMAAGLALGIF
jgi:multimeric flavodoxin WrbA